MWSLVLMRSDGWCTWHISVTKLVTRPYRADWNKSRAIKQRERQNDHWNRIQFTIKYWLMRSPYSYSNQNISLRIASPFGGARGYGSFFPHLCWVQFLLSRMLLLHGQSKNKRPLTFQVICQNMSNKVCDPLLFISVVSKESSGEATRI